MLSMVKQKPHILVIRLKEVMAERDRRQRRIRIANSYFTETRELKPGAIK